MKKTYLQPATEAMLVMTESGMLTDSLGVHDDVTVKDDSDLLSRMLDFNNGLFE